MAGEPSEPDGGQFHIGITGQPDCTQLEVEHRNKRSDPKGGSG
jgi:hypothetical protein